MKTLNTVRALILLAALLATAAQAQEQVWDFEVRLDGKPIGSHRFTLRQQGEEQVLSTRADFEVRFLGLVVYRYQHEATERWRGDCLHRMEASTQDDGKPSRVVARAEAEGLRVEVQGKPPAPSISGCVMSFAYWHPALRARAPSQLLNSQNGRLETVQLTRLPDAGVEVRGATQSAQRWRLSGVDSPIELSYSPSGDWLALDSQVRGGRMLQYRLR